MACDNFVVMLALDKLSNAKIDDLSRTHVTPAVSDVSEIG